MPPFLLALFLLSSTSLFSSSKSIKLYNFISFTISIESLLIAFINPTVPIRGFTLSSTSTFLFP